MLPMKFVRLFFILLISVNCTAQSSTSAIDSALTRRFEMAKGKLPMPVGKGRIEKEKPRKQLLACGLGQDGYIHIITTPNASIQTVFEGTVKTVALIEGTKMVIIQHGDYFTVYSNLASTGVSKGQHVNALQNIGVAAENDEGEPTVNFQIWKSAGKGSVKLNPELWIGKAR